MKKRQDALNFWQKFSTSKAKRFAFGMNEYTEYLDNIAPLDGVIDDFSEIGVWRGKPVIRLADTPVDSLVISCITSSYTTSALLNLENAGILEYIDYISVADASGGKLPQIRQITDTRADYQAHTADYEWLRSIFFDQASRDTFDRLLKFRLDGDIRAMEGFEYAVERQYFEPFLQLSTKEIFIDGGGFDGATSVEFVKRCPEYCAIHLFEPSEKMLFIAKDKLASNPNVIFHKLGLYERSATLRFDSSKGSSSKISVEGGETIDVVSLDAALDVAPTFIKLDIEGAELEALSGAKKHIVNHQPKLAVAIYHQAADFWRIPRYILSLRSDYNVYLRHYTEGWSETVMFFIPAETA